MVLLASTWLALSSRGRVDASILPYDRPEASIKRLFSNDQHSPSPAALTVVLVGDIFLGRGVHADAHVFDPIAPELVKADLAVGNLEGLIFEQERLIPGSDRPGFELFSPVYSVSFLQRAGFDILGLANNHAGDGGILARQATIQRLSAGGLRALGENAGSIQYVSSKGVRLAFLAFNAVQVPGQPGLVWDRERALQAVRQADARADGVVVLMHWGSEYDHQTGQRQRDAALALAEAGADLIAGSHPHVVQGTEVIERKDGSRAFAAYSLGNFVFDQLGDENTQKGAALEVAFTDDGLASVNALAVRSGTRPRWLSGEEAAAVFQRMIPQPKRWRIACSDRECLMEAVSPEDYQEKASRRDEIDLTGDGVKERIVYHDGKVIIYEAGVPVWQSPPEWRILDVALGDPNDDGRFEIVLALMKTDEEGVLQSHPFIIGYRNGGYRQVWGGSAVADPLAEVELGDLDGNGSDELVAIEERCTRPHTTSELASCDRSVISVWKWNGWGFTQIWKSDIGSFQNIRLSSGNPAEKVIIVDDLW